MPGDGYNPAHLFVYIPTVIMSIYLMLGLIQLYRRSHVPEQTVDATVLGKRSVRQRYASNKIYFPRKPEYNHYVTFQFEDRCIEMLVPEKDFSRMDEKDRGSLTCKGTSYIQFLKYTERRSL